jgi:hypothetical protein
MVAAKVTLYVKPPSGFWVDLVTVRPVLSTFNMYPSVSWTAVRLPEAAAVAEI